MPSLTLIQIEGDDFAVSRAETLPGYGQKWPYREAPLLHPRLGVRAEMYIMIKHPNRNTRSRLCGGLEDAIYELGEVGHYGIEFKDTDGQMKETGVFFGGKSSVI